MSRSAPVLAIAGDAGGANAIAPVISRLRKLSRPVVALAYRQARSAWSAAALALQDLAEDTDTESAIGYLRSAQAALLLTGTSFNGVDLEKRFLSAARKQGIPSIAVLDFWSNYRVRFADDQGRLAYLPDRIAVMDDHARREMVEEGFDPQRIKVTGQPAFDDLVSIRLRGAGEARANIRRRLGISEEACLVLFASQPLKQLFGQDHTNPLYPGYTQRTVLRSTVAALDRISQRRSQPITLLIRPHPREQSEDFSSLGRDHVRIVVDGSSDRHDSVMASDLVIGMTTMLLVEACLLGCIVVSLQPELRLPDPLPTNRWRASRAIYREEEIEPTLESLLLDDSVRQEQRAQATRVRFDPFAAERVIALMDELISMCDHGDEEFL